MSVTTSGSLLVTGSTNVFPPIITDGLIFYSDAANYISHTTGSNRWDSLVSSPTNYFTLFGGPTLLNENGGILSFNNTTQYVGTNQLFFPSIRNGDAVGETPDIDFELTFEIAIKIKENLSGNLAILHTTSTSYNSVGLLPLYRLSINLQNELTSISGYKKVSPGYATCSHTATYDLNQWYHITIALRKTSATTGEWYVMRNGEILSQQTLNDISYWCNYSSTVSNNGNRLDGQTNYFLHDRAFTKVYRKGLTQSQALQNFNATRDRFGI